MQPDIFRTIRRIHIQTTRLAKDILSGIYRSAFKGQGMEFEEVREYQPGDEVRSIDWKVTSRMNHPYVKVFREERELTVMLLVDVSASSRFGSKNMLKKELIAEVSAVLAFSAIKNNDNVGLILFSDHVEKYIPPAKSTRHVLRVIRELLVFTPKGTKTDVSNALAFLGHVQNKSGICFLVSDFICPDFEHEASLIALKHDMVGICISDPCELELPAFDLLSLHDLESGLAAVIDTRNDRLRRDFKEAAEARLASRSHLMGSIGAGFVDLRTDTPYIPALQKFFKIRGRHPR